MDESTNEERHPNIDVRPIAGIVRSPLDEIKAIRTLLDDVYKDAGNGRTLFRELVQNADDARASRLRLVVLDDGWSDAQNPLLRGPALLVANDGAFPDRDREALHLAIGGSKEDEADKIGTFGIGLKSVFHLCEAFLYVGAEESEWLAGVLNPWAGTGESEHTDPLHPEWDKLEGDDDERLRSVAEDLLGQEENGLLLWVPLRRPEHRNRGADGRQYGLGERCPEPSELRAWFGTPAPAALLLAQCGHLKSIDVEHAPDPESLSDPEKLVRVDRQNADWVRRYLDDADGFPDVRIFEGRINSERNAGSNKQSWSVRGIEVLGSESLRRIRDSKDWPQTPKWENGRHSSVPRKALAHAAITVLRPHYPEAGLSGTRLRWAAFLPLDDDPEPHTSAIVESVASSPAWEIILHGYFWTSQDRRSIAGVTEDIGDGDGGGNIRIRWNRTLCEELLLPLLPSALANAVAGIEERVVRKLLDVVAYSNLVANHRTSIKRRDWLLPIIAADGVRWKALDVGSCSVLSIPRWSKAPEPVRRRFVATCNEHPDDALFIDDDAPRLADGLDHWTKSRLERLLNSIPEDVVECPQSLRWISGVVRHALGSDVCGEDIRAVAVAKWLADRIAGGAPAHTTRGSTAQELRDELREAWQELCDTLPKAWLVEVPVKSQQAVAELAADGVIGEGLFPMPFGHRRGESLPAPQLDQERLHCALSALGRRLEAGDESRRLRNSRLLLAERLLATRGNRPMVEPLVGLPLLRALRLPEDREDAWSIAELQRQVQNRRVFAGATSRASNHGGTDEDRPEQPSDPRQAVTDLARALDMSIWLVAGDAVASVAAHVPSPAQVALADVVLRADKLAAPAHRKPLLMRLAPKIYDGATLRRAARSLLAGRSAEVVGEDAELFYDHSGNGRALRILLRLINQSWRAVQWELVESLSQTDLHGLGVRPVDREALSGLLGDCLANSVDWTNLSIEEAVRLLQDLHSAVPEEQKRWRRMPLHRGIDAKRGALNEGDLRCSAKPPELRLPPELEINVRILDPDSEVAHLYDFVPTMNRNGLLRLLLGDPRPWRFAERIVHEIRSAEGQVALPSTPELRELLKRKRWLPNRTGDGLAPEDVLIAPQELLDAAAGLAAATAFGDKRFPDAVNSGIWRKAKSVVREILGRPGRKHQVQRIVDALDADSVAQADGGAWLVLPDPDFVDASLILDALQTNLASSHSGWMLVHAVDRAVRHNDDQPHLGLDPLVQLTKALCGPVPAKRQIKMLASLADTRPAKDSPGGRLFRRILDCFAKLDHFQASVLPEITLPTQDGNWHSSADVARTETGVARRHLLLAELRPMLIPNGSSPVSGVQNGNVPLGQTYWDAPDIYFDPWEGHVHHGAVGAFLSLLGTRNGHLARLAETWLGEDVAIEPVDEFNQDIGVWISPRIARGGRVNAVNVLGLLVEMDAEADVDTLFAVDPVRHEKQAPPSSPLARLGRGWWEITLRDIDPQSRSTRELVQLLGGTVERWGTRHLGLDREKVKKWWAEWGTGSQADFAPVLASIKAHLPLTLQQLNVKESQTLSDALRKSEQAQRKREQAPSEEALNREQKALDRLTDLIGQSQYQKFLWKRVYEKMQRYGYRPESVLLELAQNADDALAEAAEINGGSLPSITCRLVVRIHDLDGRPTVDFMHWGRAINDTGGAAFPAGRERQWDQDLYFMMLMNLSGKPGEAPGDSSPSSTTGRFGLGFKSVHLVSSSPSVVSDFLAFSIAGGLLPQEQPMPDEADSWRVEARRGTRIRLPLRPDVEAQALLEQLFHRFACARVLLPVLSRQVREVVVEGGPFPGVHAFDGTPIDGAPGWSIGTETELPEHPGRWRILRFRPADAGRSGMGTLALAVGLREGCPAAFESNMPFLCNVVPTSESWGCGYVVNGPFKLDPGRTHVSLDDDTTLQAVGTLGEEVGRGLIELHDALLDPTDEVLRSMVNHDGKGFLSSLWRVLACGLNDSDDLRRKFLHELHGNGRGISAWMAARPVVPTDLPAPFRPLLPRLTSDVRIEVAVGELDDQMCGVLTSAADQDDDMAKLIGCRHIVSAEVAQLLRPLWGVGDKKMDFVTQIPFHPSTLFAELVERWDHCLTPDRLHALRPFDSGSDTSFANYDLDGATWRTALRARAANGSFQPLRNLLLGHAKDRFDHPDSDSEDELLRAAFAPRERVLDRAYIECGEDWRVFRWLRDRHRVDAATIADWYIDLKPKLRPASLRYLLYGQLQQQVLSLLIPASDRPQWLQDFDNVRRALGDLCDEPWRRQRLLGSLFPDRFRAPEVPPQTTTADSETFFINLLEWWDNADVRGEVISTYERNAWPGWLRSEGVAEGLRTDSADHWLALLVLGACRSLGRTMDGQHRSFIELAQREGWWEVFKTPDAPSEWMKMLRDWQDCASAELRYGYWMSLFPTIYQFSRYRETYVRLLKSAGRRPETSYQVTRLLAPRVDEALTGAGGQFDAPPAPLGIGVHWILRELVRLQVVEGEHLHPDCWVPSKQVIEFLVRLGLDRPDDGASSPNKAHAVFEFLVSKLGTESPTLHGAFDIPLRHVASKLELRRRFGLEE